MCLGILGMFAVVTLLLIETGMLLLATVTSAYGIVLIGAVTAQHRKLLKGSNHVLVIDKT